MGRGKIYIKVEETQSRRSYDLSKFTLLVNKGTGPVSPTQAALVDLTDTVLRMCTMGFYYRCLPDDSAIQAFRQEHMFTLFVAISMIWPMS